ncbi:hypothetical protein [Fluviicola sp.]|uniref:hypothetical protein n=1 Tax=Fluviicola sp. TaxID=1917219 RepID=UPI002601A929|nr:hypothetical protein [Fluviicola sp.]
MGASQTQAQTMNNQHTGGSRPVQLRKVQTSTHSNASDSLAGETITHCDAMLEAIDQKVAYIRSDQSMSERAQADGWFDKMASYRAKYLARKEALIQREKQQESH